jgi:hypothetical protein
VGHSSFTATDEGAIYLQDDDGLAAEVDSTLLANLVADQSNLRLAVLNSCDGARTTLHDPYAGVATTLIQLGVPAVVAMQFEISDYAAILFADELYTNLIGRQDPIDAAVAEARKAIYVEIDRVEWATPVLFVRDPDVQLFDFNVPVAALPPPRPAEMRPPDAPPTDSPPPPPIAADDPPPARGGWRSHLLLIGGLTMLASIVVFIIAVVLFYSAASLSDADIVARGETGGAISFEHTGSVPGQYTVYLDKGVSSAGATADDVACEATVANGVQRFDGRSQSMDLESNGREAVGSFSAPPGAVIVTCATPAGDAGHLLVAKGGPPSVTPAVVWWLVSVTVLLTGFVVLVNGVIRAIRARRHATPAR